MTSLQTSLQHTAIIGANVYSLTNVRFVRPIIILILCDLKMVYSDISCHVFWSFLKKKKTSYKIQTGVPTFVVISLHSTKVCSFVVPASYLFFYTVQLQFQTIKCTHAPYLSLKADMKFLQKYNSS